ncbi:MAG TPA: hypothetical protein VGO93_31555, partial [Candidatus Xenobia bacterium]
MKSVTASEARKNWFRLLDEVAAGEVVAIRRGRKRLVLRCEANESELPPDYTSLIGGANLDQADQWSWE